MQNTKKVSSGDLRVIKGSKPVYKKLMLNWPNASVPLDQFNIDASIVFQLGEQLITDEIQALIELIKNSYDADAKSISININTNLKPPKPWKYSEAVGYILITDNGNGMNIEEIRSGWLTLSNSYKKSEKASKDNARGKRLPLGDKGLGRLGSQKLGDNLEMSSIKKEADKSSEEENYIGFSWKDFVGRKNLSAVPIIRTSVKTKKPHGTRIMISGLKNPSVWIDTDERLLATRMSEMLSPFEENGLKVTIKVDAKPIDLAKIGNEVLATAGVGYDLKFDGEELTVTGKIKMNYLRPSSKAENGPEIEAFHKMVEQDHGRSLLAYILEDDKSKSFQIEASLEEEWYLTFGYRKKLTSYTGVRMVDDDIDIQNKKSIANTKQIANPGKFSGKIYGVSLDRFNANRQKAFLLNQDFRNYVKNLSGIRVFRDGFAVRVDKDWLGLGRQQTSANSYNGLKPSNTIGYISISVADNSQLEETTSREGFTNSVYYQNLLIILSDFINEAEKFQNFLRRKSRAYYSDAAEQLKNVSSNSSPEEVAEALASTMTQIEQLRQPVASIAQRFANQEKILTASDMALQDVRDIPSDVLNAQKTLRNEIEKSAGLISDLQKLVLSFEGLENTGKLLVRQISDLRMQVQDMYSIIGLGLSAEVLSHEVSMITNRVITNVSKMRVIIKNNGWNDLDVSVILNDTHASMMALRKQIAHIDPSLKYAKNLKEKVVVSKFIASQMDFYQDNLIRKGISIEIENILDFSINISRGKLIQVIDNLILNSEYWVLEKAKFNENYHGRITLSIDRPFIRIRDDGPGVDPLVRDFIFDPFVTAKNNREGRGLGLFISNELMSSEGASLSLRPEYNLDGREYIFEIDFSGISI